MGQQTLNLILIFHKIMSMLSIKQNPILYNLRQFQKKTTFIMFNLKHLTRHWIHHSHMRHTYIYSKLHRALI